MRIDQWICGVILCNPLRKCSFKTKNDTEINNTKLNKFAFRFLTWARFWENRVASMMISLLSRDGIDSIIIKVCSSIGWSWSISCWVSSSLSWMAKILTFSLIRVFYAVSLFLRKRNRRSNTRKARDMLKPYIPSTSQS